MLKAAPAALVSIRTCSGCGRPFDKERLVRLVLSPARRVELDYGHKLAGRGAYLFPSRACFDLAGQGKGLARSFKEGRYSYEAERLWAILVRANRERMLQDVRLALKAGGVVSGSNTVEDALKRGGVQLILVAEDAAANTMERFAQAASAKGRPCVRALSSEELGRVLGKESRFVCAVTQAPFASKLLKDVAIYDAIRSENGCPEKKGSGYGEASSI